MKTSGTSLTKRTTLATLLKPSLVALFIFFCISPATAQNESTSSCIKMAEPFYNYRIIDNTLFAGGSFFKIHKQASGLKKSIERGLAELRKSGVLTVVKLNKQSEENAYAEGLEEKNLVTAAGLNFFPCPIGSGHTPDASQTRFLLDLIDKKAFIHCTWGCDRTGAIIAKYLRVRKGYSGKAAWQAIIKGGSHSGNDGGFAKKEFNKENVLYFWPEVVRESPDVCAIYGITFQR